MHVLFERENAVLRCHPSFLLHVPEGACGGTGGGGEEFHGTLRARESADGMRDVQPNERGSQSAFLRRGSSVVVVGKS